MKIPPAVGHRGEGRGLPDDKDRAAASAEPFWRIIRSARQFDLESDVPAADLPAAGWSGASADPGSPMPLDFASGPAVLHHTTVAAGTESRPNGPNLGMTVKRQGPDLVIEGSGKRVTISGYFLDSKASMIQLAHMENAEPLTPIDFARRLLNSGHGRRSSG